MGQNQSASGAANAYPRSRTPLHHGSIDPSQLPVNPVEYPPKTRADLFLHTNNSMNSLSSSESYPGLASPASITSADSFGDDLFSPIASDGFFPQFNEDWMAMFPQNDLFTLPETVEPVSPRPSKRQRTSACDCPYCTPQQTTTEDSKLAALNGPNVFHLAPPMELHLQIDTAPKPKIIGQHSLGTDIALLQQQMQIQHAQRLLQQSPQRSRFPQNGQITYDGFDGRPYMGDALTYL